MGIATAIDWIPLALVLGGRSPISGPFARNLARHDLHSDLVQRCGGGLSIMAAHREIAMRTSDR